MTGAAATLVVLDDDPTGTQSMADVPVVLHIDDATVAAAASTGASTIHLMTNSRALGPTAARRCVVDAALTARRVLPTAHLVLRGDSTLRGHLWEEYDGLRAVVHPDHDPVLLLAPALPDAGRITLGGVHLLEENGRRRPLHETAYARDPAFGYRDARLLTWAAHRSAGAFDPGRGDEVHLDALRAGGPTVVARTLQRLAAQPRPVVCAVDAVLESDLGSILAGYRSAVEAGVPALLRTAPAGAGVLSGATARRFAPWPRGADRVLVVCGSYVPRGSRQLAALRRAHPAALVEVDPDDLQTAGQDRLVDRVSADVERRLQREGLAVLATARPGRDGPGDLARQAQLAHALVAIVRALERQPDVLITKGGVTSATIVRDGIGVPLVQVVGPVTTGVGRWDLDTRNGPLTCLVVPGNVGGEGLLVDLVDGVRRPVGDG